MSNLTTTPIVGAQANAGQERWCECFGPGHCERYGRQMVGRLFSICQGTAEGVSEEKAVQYRRHWLAQVGKPQTQQAATSAKPCRFLGRRARNPDRSVKARDCGLG